MKSLNVSVSLPQQHPDPGQHVWALHVQRRRADQAGPVRSGGRGASGRGPAEAGQQAPRPHDGGPGADGQVQPGAPDHDGAERRRRQDQSLRLHPQAEETPQQGHAGDQEVSEPEQGGVAAGWRETLSSKRQFL